MATTESQKYITICLAAVYVTAVSVAIFLLFGSLLFAALNQSVGTTAGEQCIACHVSVYNQGIESRTVHQPFWEKSCVLCHLAEGAVWPSSNRLAANTGISGTLVNQENLWRKTLTFMSFDGPAFEQRCALPTLELGTAYRFRIIVSQSPATSIGQLYPSPWLGLRPAELDADSDVPLEVKTGQAEPGPALISLSRTGGQVFIAWQTNQLLYGWVEVQPLAGQGIETPLPASDGSRPQTARNQHPPLKVGAELAINACFQCHPETTLGTSHPVRLYAGKDVQIPEHLPTVDGMLTCVTCHDPHGAVGKKLVREIITTKLCITCHYRFQNSSPSTVFD